MDIKPIPEYQNEAVKKYIKEKRDTIQVYLPKGYAHIVKKHAKKFQAQEGEPGKAGYVPMGSVSAFVYRAIREAIERDVESENPKPEVTHEQVMQEDEEIRLDEKYYDKDEALQLRDELGLAKSSRRTFERAVKSGKLVSAKKRGKKNLYSHDCVIAWDGKS